MANPGRDADAAVIHGQRLSASGKFERLGGRERSVSSRLGSFYSSRFLMIAELASSMSQVQVDQKTYQMPPQDGFTVAYFLTVADIERSARFYETVFGGCILSRGPPGYIQIANTWIARKWCRWESCACTPSSWAPSYAAPHATRRWYGSAARRGDSGSTCGARQPSSRGPRELGLGRKVALEIMARRRSGA